MGPGAKGTTTPSSSSSKALDGRAAASQHSENYSPSQLPGEESVHSSQEYPIKFILDESGGKYLIAWEGPFEPTWEPKSCASYAAVRAWEVEKQKRYISAKQYKEQRPRRTCQTPRRKPLDFVSSPSPGISTQQSIEASQPSSSNPHSSIPSFSQATASSGSIFCPETQSQGTQTSRESSGRLGGSSSIASTENQSSYHTLTPRRIYQYNQDSSIPDSTAATWVLESTASSYILRGRTSTSPRGSPPQQLRQDTEQNFEFLARNYQPSQGTISAKSATHSTSLEKEHSQRKLRDLLFGPEVLETPPSRLPVLDRLEGLSHQIGEPGFEIDSPISRRVTDQSSPEFQTPFTNSNTVAGSCPSIPKSEYQGAVDQHSYSKASLSRSFIEESPLATTSSRSKNNNRTLRRTVSEVVPKSSNLEYQHHLNRLSASITMNSSAPDSNASGTSANAEEVERHTRATSVSEKMKQLWDSDRALRKPLNSLPQSTTSSSAGDILPSAPPNASDIISPLNPQLDKGTANAIGNEAPSSVPIPFVTPQALHYNVEQVTSVPEALESTMQTETTEFEASSPQEQNQDALELEVNVLSLSEMEFAIPLSMDCRVKDEYDNTLEGENKYVEKFLESSPQSSEMGSLEGDSQGLITRMAILVEKLDNITTHPDINIASQAAGTSPDTAKEALWAEYSSSKFQYLGYLIDSSSELDLHIIIMAKPGRTVDVVKRYLMGKNFNQSPFPGGEHGDPPAVFSKEKVSFEVRSTTDERGMLASRPPSLIIALDSSFDVNLESVKKLRVAHGHSTLVPVVRLIIANTVEHVKACLPKCTELTRLRLLVQHTLACNDSAGELQDDALGVQENAEETLMYIMDSPTTRTWKLPFMEALEIEGQGETPGSELDPMSSTNALWQKRWLESELSDSTNPSKRQRITPTQDITHVSDSVKDLTQMDQNSNPSATQSHTNQAATDIEALRHALTNSKAKVKTLEASIGALQYRYEEKHNLFHQTRHELEIEREKSQKSQTRFERQKEEITRLKDRNAELVTELEAARNTIKSGGGLESDLEKSREEIRKLEKSLASLERTVQQERSQTEYTRQQYQNASTSAAQSAMEARRLEERVQELEKKANGEAVRLKELKMKKDGEIQLARIKELESLLATRETLLTRKEEEIREMKKNRPSTRATSMQPRSPKYGTSRPSSPGPNNIGSAVWGSALKFRAEI
ncbi:Class II histone deacetylase complex subunits 2 and 3-domain-containing protein [Trichophyton interdigitale]|uniref:Class II histone deacetylase complex subunits 2 and 3-domain-containing protein n=1 Tax=Trichophyton interdigitale TaxID=101480 RepID=A0A9P4YN53_9EURO|nr:Class II histone deacetylase complex subunits 2 and 3-domain-containing protein [Trichophyton interdigitale]KAF3901039.1 Class II histone deacetylase complex subunits 2 and 3-domain-containing protein [Trichophyton interdigitale]